VNYAWLIEFPKGDFPMGSFGPEWLSAEGGFVHWDRDAWKALWFASKDSAEKFLAASIHDKLVAVVTQHGFDSAALSVSAGERPDELALYKEAWEARHSYGHKQGIASPQAERLRKAEAAVKAFRESVPEVKP
jgi:hypothetical protein